MPAAPIIVRLAGVQDLDDAKLALADIDLSDRVSTVVFHGDLSVDTLCKFVALPKHLRCIMSGDIKPLPYWSSTSMSSLPMEFLPLPSVRSVTYTPHRAVALPTAFGLLASTPNLERLALRLSYSGQEHAVTVAIANGSVPSLDHLRLKSYTCSSLFLGCELPIAQSSDTLEELSLQFNSSAFRYGSAGSTTHTESAHAAYWQTVIARLVAALREFVYMRLHTLRLAGGPSAEPFSPAIFRSILSECVALQRLDLSVDMGTADGDTMRSLRTLMDSITVPLREFSARLQPRPARAEHLQSLLVAVKTFPALRMLRVLEFDGGFFESEAALFPARAEALSMLRHACTLRRIRFVFRAPSLRR